MSQPSGRRMILGLRPGPMGEGAGLADQAGLDFVLMGDRGGAIGQDPLSVAAFLMTTTRHLGLAAAVGADWAPFNVARALASFDNLSGGRGGWLPLYGRAEAARDAEHLDVVLQLFDSWDDDALVFDKANAIFADRDKVRRIRHAGAYFTVDGPLNAPRPPQGRPVLFQPLENASREADVLLVDLERLAPGMASPPALLLAEVAFGAEDPVEAFVEALARPYERGDCDGFVVAPADPAADTAVLVGEVVPRLRARGLALPDESRGDFRSRLGLARPHNRFATIP